MLLHNHDNPDGDDLLVLHINREEAEALVKAISGALEEAPESDSFSVNLGTTQHLHNPNDERIFGEEETI